MNGNTSNLDYHIKKYKECKANLYDKSQQTIGEIHCNWHKMSCQKSYIEFITGKKLDEVL